MKTNKDQHSKVRRKTLQLHWEEGEAFQLKPAKTKPPQQTPSPVTETALLPASPKATRNIPVPPAA
jgi:hypothetical protein